MCERPAAAARRGILWPRSQPSAARRDGSGGPRAAQSVRAVTDTFWVETVSKQLGNILLVGATAQHFAWLHRSRSAGEVQGDQLIAAVSTLHCSTTAQAG